MSRDTGQKRRDNAATFAATKTPKRRDTCRDNAATHWLSVAEVSRLEGIAPRTVQRRCTTGKYTFRTLETANGPRFEIDADSLKNGTATETENAATTPRQNENFAATFAATRRDNSDQNAATMETELRDQLEREREQNQFLRGVIEQLQRDVAESHAEHRAALKIIGATSTPQLTQGDAPESQKTPQTGAATKDSHADQRGPQKPAERKGATDWNSVYGQIADELEAQEQNR